jgi:hypothetical protein
MALAYRSSPAVKRVTDSEWSWALGTMAVTSACVAGVLRLWRADLGVPIDQGGDATQIQMLIKSLIDHPWYQHNPNLGAPFGQTLYDWPGFVGDHLQLLALKLLTLFSGSVGVVVNAYYLLSFPAVALVAFLVLRRLGVSRGSALVCASLFSLLPYHFERRENHLFLAVYVSVPWAHCWPCAWRLVMSYLHARPARDASARC